jgi:hypothetical protein
MKKKTFQAKERRRIVGIIPSTTTMHQSSLVPSSEEDTEREGEEGELKNGKSKMQIEKCKMKMKNK